MFVKISVSLIFSLVLLANGCNSKSSDSQSLTPANSPQTASASPSSAANVNSVSKPESTASPSGAGFIDACALIEKAEIQAVQGAPVQSTVPSTQSSGALAISQCYYTVSSGDGSKNLSVHLEVIQADPKSPNAVKEYWERSFGEKGKTEKGEREEEEKESKPPQRVSGVGEEAFWIGNSRVGALYALKKGKLVRVSIGGADDPKTRLEKTKKLVVSVLKRLS